jgi:hypothetical protein
VTMHFFGGELPSFIPSDSTGKESTLAGTFDPGFSRCSLRPGGTTGVYCSTPTLALPDAFYTKIYFKRDTASSMTTTLVSYLAADVEVFRVTRTDGTGYLQMQVFIGDEWVNVGSAVSFDATAAHHLDLYIDGNSATGTATLFLGGTQRETAVADLTPVVAIDEVRFYYGCYVSQVVIDTEPTIGRRLGTRYPNGAGAVANWTGGSTDVDEIICDDADFCNSSTNGQIEQFTQTGAAITGYTVLAVGVYARSKKGGSGPENLQIGIRASAADYFSTDKAQSVGYSAYGEIWETNPATGVAWLNTAIDAIQPSIKAVT